MPLNLPDKELHAVIRVSAATAECVDRVHATAVVIEAFSSGEFSSAEQVDSWFCLQRIKQPKFVERHHRWGARLRRACGVDDGRVPESQP